MNELLGMLLYYGSAVVPLGYLFGTRFRGRVWRAFLIALVLQIVASMGVSALTAWCRDAGYREWYWAMAYNIPVNILFATIYLIILWRSRREPPVSA
jgi:hypothetical protein